MDRLSLSQEGIADLLGVQRTSVSLVANALKRRGLIVYNRGRISITDRAGLEAVACECYRKLQRHAARNNLE